MNEETIPDELFGQMTWDAELESWMGRAELADGRSIQVRVSPDNVPLEDAMEMAHHVFARTRDHEPRLRKGAADEFLSEEDMPGEPVTHEDFLTGVTPLALACWSDGTATLYYDDGDLLGGPTVVVSINEGGALRSAGVTDRLPWIEPPPPGEELDAEFTPDNVSRWAEEGIHYTRKPDGTYRIAFDTPYFYGDVVEFDAGPNGKGTGPITDISLQADGDLCYSVYSAEKHHVVGGINVDDITAVFRPSPPPGEPRGG